MKLEDIKTAVQSYLNANGLKAGTKTGLKAEHAFICGIQSALRIVNGEEYALPAYVTICALSGRSIID